MSNHPYIWGVLVPMVVSAVVSIFAKEIRAILGAIAVSGGRSLNQRFIGLLEDRLKLIQKIHGNSYNLLLWLCLEIRPAVIESIALGVVGMLGRIYRPYAWWWHVSI